VKKNLLVIERNSRNSLSGLLTREGYSVCLAETASAGLEALKRYNITHVIVLNAMSMRTSGGRTCSSLKKAAPNVPVLIYSDQEKPAGADVLLRPGITIRKIVNRIELFSPVDKNACILHGEICLDEEKQRVITANGVSHLPTKGIEILKLLIGKKGALVTKEELFTRIWETEYTGDLNTLYTNISFIRDAIEPDPAHPRYLHTVRGKGYRLDGK